MENFFHLTYLIIAVTVGISFYGFKNPTFIKKWMMNPYLINTRGQYYRFLTSGFIHKDHVHLLFNMISFYFFGMVVERVFKNVFQEFSWIYFLGLYLLAILVSDIPTFFKQKDNPGYNALGASGGVSAVIFAFVIFEPLRHICLYFALCLPGFILGTLYVVYSYYQGTRGKDNINHDAHLYGALFGILFCVVLYPPSLKRFIEQIINWRIFD
jgi:membrane associated rhomboid family serine protease